MKLTPVKSSNIKSVGYDKKTKTLSIRFYSGGTYEYSDVNNPIYEDFINSESLGRFFFRNIKTKYSTKKVS